MMMVFEVGPLAGDEVMRVEPSCVGLVPFKKETVLPSFGHVRTQ